MPKEKKPRFELKGVDEFFMPQEMRDEAKLAKIHEIPIEEIDDFPDHPYKVKDDEDMMNLMERIRDNGVLTPATVRKKDDGRYEMLSGHRRKRACELLGMEVLRCEVVELDRDSATIFMCDSNLQRTTILPSEKAFSYKMRLEAMNRKAGRPSKDNLTPVESDFDRRRTNELLGKEVGESREQIRRYIRLTELIPEILELVDEGKIALRPAVETAKGYSITAISKELNRNKSTISRELKRNSSSGIYTPCKAQLKYHERRRSCKPKKRLDNPLVWKFVRDKFLEHQWSPEQIAGRLRYENSNIHISYSTIYRGIYAGCFDTPEQRKSHGHRGAIRKLRHHGKTRHSRDHQETRSKIRISNSISDRPNAAESRSRLGDWEADTVMGKTGMACLVTLVDRKSRFLLMQKATKKTSVYVTPVIIDLLKNQPLETITPDRGKEFSKHADITNTLNNVQFYFPLPHQPWQRGSNENTNGLLREYFPKGQDITVTSEEYIQAVALELNCRPRKCLGYLTPFEVFYSTVLHLT